MNTAFRALIVMILILMLFIYPGHSANAQSGDLSRGAPPVQALQVTPAASQTDRIIVKFKDAAESPSSQAQAADSLSATAGVSMRHLRSMADNAQVLELRERLSLDQVQSLSEQLMALPEVEYAEPDQMFQATLVPNDSRYGEQWEFSGTWGINLPTAWNITTGLSSTVVAVVDTGITNHADLSGRTVPGYDFIFDVATANDGNGRDNNPSDPGDWTNASECGSGSSASNSSWHGTHVAGTIGANSNNAMGVSGINWNAKILPVRVLGKCGGYLSDIADGIAWAAGVPVAGVPLNANPARVINVSITGGGSCSNTYQTAINNANARGAIIVVAAGNSNQDSSQFQPGNCSGVITVGATAGDAYRATYSNYGTTVEISAPGGDMPYDDGILSTKDSGTTIPAGDTYAVSQGTSMAAPHVAGVVSLMLARNPYLTFSQVLQILQSTAKPFPSNLNPTYDENCYVMQNCGAGIIDATAALNATPVQTFADVPGSYWAWNFVERMSNAGITGGCGTGPVRYCPEGTVTRAQMAVFLLKSIHGSSYAPPGVGAGSGFSDVPPSYWAAAWIKQLAAEGITSGCGSGIYCPESPVNRAQMAIFLLRAKYGTSYAPPGVGAGTGFGDVPSSYWAARWIKQLVTEGITSGCASGNYCPESPVTRAQMAVFLVKTFGLP